MGRLADAWASIAAQIEATEVGRTHNPISSGITDLLQSCSIWIVALIRLLDVKFHWTNVSKDGQ